MFYSVNNSSTTVNIPASFKSIENLDLIDKLQSKISPTEMMMAKISSAGNRLADKIQEGLQKAKEYLKKL